MALSLKDQETDSLARQVASLTGETLTEAVRGALRERLRNEQIKRGHRPAVDWAAIDALLARFDALPVLDTTGRGL
jgi:antitoxin VapB